jgi:very-short-patch-repair endonuclease
VHLALHQAGAPFLRQIIVGNPGEEDVRDVVVDVTVDPPFAPPFRHAIDVIPAAGVARVDTAALPLSPTFLAAARERTRGHLNVVVTVGGVEVARHAEPVEVLAPAEWPGTAVLPELLAAFVRPNARGIASLTQAAARILADAGHDDSLEGYQRHDARRVALLAEAGWKAVAQAGVGYVGMAASFEQHGQKIRSHEAVLADKQANCLDVSVLVAAVWEAMGLHPVLVIVDAHAFPGVWLTDFRLHEPTLDDPLPLHKRVELGEALVVDSSAAVQGTPFADAVRSAESALKKPDNARLIVDVAAARDARVLPLPLELDPKALAAAVIASTTQAPNASSPSKARVDDAALGAALPDARFRPASTPPEDANAARGRLERWKAKLLDLSLRNRLLNHKDGNKVLALPHLDVAAFEDQLAAGDAFELLAATPPKADPRSDGVDPLQRARVDLDQKRVRTASPQAELDRRATELFRAARSAEEESGAVLLYVALGELHWFESETSTTLRRAPLVLVPVRLERTRGAGGTGWRLRRAEDETRINVTLLKKLAVDFGIDTAGLETLVEDHSGVDVGRALHDVRRIVRDRPRWQVVEHATLSLFSFQKFLMWLDLHERTDDLLGAPVVRHLFQGGGRAFGLAAPIVADDDVESARPPDRLVTVVDADPTQLAAIHAAVDGSSFVLQGPPGTGKSQTITNLIAQLLADGRSVLFVSEKRAALDVVHRRLTAVGLGPFTLELHAQHANKAEVFRQLRDAFEAPLPAPSSWQEHAGTLAATRRQLTAHAERLARPSPFRGSTRAAFASLFGLHDAAELELPGVDARTLTPAFVDAIDAATHEFARAVDDAGPRDDQPWAGVGRFPWRPALDDEAAAVANDLARCASAVEAALATLRADLRLPDAMRDDDVFVAARLAVAAPGAPRALVTASRAALAPVRDSIARVAMWQQQRAALLAGFHDGILRVDVDGLLARFRRWRDAFVLLSFFALWGARRMVRALSHGGRGDDGALVDGLTLAATVRDGEVALRGDTTGPQLGPWWRGPDTDPMAATAAVDHAEALRRFQLVQSDLLGDPAALDAFVQRCTDDVDVLAADAPVGARVRAAVAMKAALDTAVQAATNALQLDGRRAFGETPRTEQLRTVAERWRANLPRLRAQCALAETAARCRAVHIDAAVDAVLEGRLSANDVERAVQRAVRVAWWKAQLNDDAALANFRGRRHDDVIARFQQLDRAALAVARDEVVARLRSRVPDANAPGDDMAKLRKQLLLQRGQWSVRRLFRELPALLQRMKPCVLMSPLSVAQVLQAGHRFDVVIFDEASQIPPWDAVGAIGRGQQVIVVGDSKQMPPTSFFDRGEDPDAADVVDDEDIVDVESILDESVASGLPQLRLRWHYRSQHESLIAFSNHHYYDNALLTFPSALLQGRGAGVEFVAVDGFYDRGRARHNVTEAHRIVDELARLLSLPDDERPSVGVVTFSMPQQTLVQDLVDQLLVARPELGRFFTDAVDEPVFVKNLENVQGDERDVMLFSVCYGPDASGRVTMNFGPLNRKGGERRLNVAVTRARRRLVVYSTLDWTQVSDHGSSSVGVAHLKSFLRYAKEDAASLLATASAPGAPDFGSPFEREVFDVLVAAGHSVHSQVGCSGYRIDLAVVDPARSGAYVLAIETDGATYHGTRAARARDRLRQQVLESLGWRFHRVWSTDWWHDRRGETERLLAAVDAALRAPSKSVKTVSTPAPPSSPPVARPNAASAPPTLSSASGSTPPSFAAQVATGPSIGLPPEARRWQPMPVVAAQGTREQFNDRAQTTTIAVLFSATANAYGPLSVDAACRRVAAAWGLQVGSRIRARILEAAAFLPSAERPGVVGEFVWPAGVQPATWRGFRVADEGSDRDVDDVPVEEIANAAAWVLSAAVSCSREALVKEVGARLGIGTRSKAARARLDGGVERLVHEGRGRVDGERLLAQ